MIFYQWRFMIIYTLGRWYNDFYIWTISKLNDTELIVYNYIVKNVGLVLKMNIRELAAQSHVSTATITRFCHKLDCDGFVEFKIELKRFNEINKMPEIDDEITMLIKFLIILREKNLMSI